MVVEGNTMADDVERYLEKGFIMYSILDSGINVGCPRVMVLGGRGTRYNIEGDAMNLRLG